MDLQVWSISSGNLIFIINMQRNNVIEILEVKVISLLTGLAREILNIFLTACKVNFVVFGYMYIFICV